MVAAWDISGWVSRSD